MRILTVANQLGAWGGMERSQLAVCRALAQRGHRIDLVYVSGGDFLEEWRAVTDSMTAMDSTLPRTGSPFTSSYHVLGAAQDVRDIQPDVIYAYRYLDLPFANAVSRVTRAPVVLHLCFPPPRRLPFVIRRSLSSVAMTLAVSFDTAARWRDTTLPADSVVVVHTGIDTEIYAPASAAERAAVRESLAIDPEAFVVLYAGRLCPERGLDVLMEAARLLHARLQRFQLVMVGGPNFGTDPREAARYRAELQARSGPIGTRWLGRQRDIVPLIGAADVAVIPSRWDEPFSRTIVEALACGVPVVATEVGSNPEILVDWLDRFLVPPTDAAAMAEALADLEGWRTIDPDLGTRCRNAVVDRFSLGREVDTVEAALASVARHRPADPLEAYR